ncbi:MAG: FecR domain-containing protein [Gammaproteobacteria bacterium]|nr:FecR domain-containing protein [Gammaproteobacteria bacterium]
MSEIPRHENDDLRKLLELAGPRPEPSRELYDDVYAQVHATWKQRHRRRWTVSAAAAAMIGAVGLAWLLLSPQQSEVPVVVASIERSFGELSALNADSTRLLSTGDTVLLDQRLRSGENSGAALRLQNGVRLRLDQLSTLSVVGNRIHLHQGRLYIDTLDSGARVEIQTKAGVIRNLGTRFEVLANGDETRVRVRDGEVHIDTGNGAVRAQRGESLQLRREGVVERTRFSPSDPHWDWTLRVATPFETDQASVAELAHWVAHESGRTLSFDDPRTGNAARVTRISGSIQDLAPLSMLQTALLATRFSASVSEDQIVISRETDN